MLEGMALLKFVSAVMEKYGIHVAFAVLVLGYYAKARVDMMRLGEASRENARVRDEEAKLKEHAAIIQELAASRKDHRDFIETNFQREQESQKNLITVLTEMSGAIRQMTTDIKDHRVEERERAGKFYEKLESIHRAALRPPHDA